jgi:nanoRNase/pAp phosphatase (c-di-AMP/oligoRNAs hydrolase)
MKTKIVTIAEKNRIIGRILDAMTGRMGFLILGHKSADDDCIASMISTALILRMLGKEPVLYLGTKPDERFRYLLNIAAYNEIPIVNAGTALPQAVDTMILCDTPKPEMIDVGAGFAELCGAPDVLKIEFDHHLGADSGYFGDEGYRLVTEASSCCELIGHLLLKMAARKDLQECYQIADFFPRNLVLSILTGIIGDSNMGQFLKSRREKRYYGIFSGMFNQMLARQTVKKTNFSTMDQVYGELQRLSGEQQACHDYLMARKRFTPSIGLVALSRGESAPLHAAFDSETVVATARLAADRLAEESGKLGLVVYYDAPEAGNLVQFRLRRSAGFRGYDLRRLLPILLIANGGGHEGAIGFRVPQGEIADFGNYVERLTAGIETALAETGGTA